MHSDDDQHQLSYGGDLHEERKSNIVSLEDVDLHPAGDLETPTGGGFVPLVYNLIIVANPRSGSQNAAKFIEKHGEGEDHDVKVVS